MRRAGLVAFLCVCILALLFQQGYFLTSLKADAQAEDLFADVSQQAGIVNSRSANVERAIGQAWGDYDQDGWVDLYVTDPKGSNHLYHNQGDGTFVLSPLSSQVALPQEYSNGAVFADYDNDGWPDLFVVDWGQNHLFHNDQGKGFTDVTAQAGLIRNPANGRTASWGDYDNDGYLDLFVANWSCYPNCGRPSTGDGDHLYHNDGKGHFTDVTEFLSSKVMGASFVAGFTDYNNDGKLDIFLVNDEFINPVGTALWRNDGPGCKGWCFTDVSKTANADYKLFGMGLATGDYNNDGKIDLFFTNGGPMVLLQNQGDGTFKNVARAAGVEDSDQIAWGTVFLDYNNDGWRDLYVAVMETANGKDVANNPLYRNNGDGTFTQVACNVGVSDVHASMGVAYADYDHDGWVDMVVGNMDNGYRLYRNQGGDLSENHWLMIELQGSGLVNRDAVGARVYVTTADGKRQLQEIVAGSSLGAGNELALSFGLGSVQTADLEVIWPNGEKQTFQHVSADQRYKLVYGAKDSTGLAILSKAAVKTRPQAVGSYGLLADGALLLMLAGFLLFNLAAWRSLRSAQSALPGRLMWAFGIPVSIALVFLTAAPAVRAWKMPLWMARTDDQRLQVLLDQAGVHPLTRMTFSKEMVKLGEALFWDPELSGNRDTACATCHHASFATGDALSVSIGTLGRGLGALRVPAQGRRLVPRNAPPVFNFGYTDWKVLFLDGRVSGSKADGFATPAFNFLPAGLDNVLAAQAMFPVTSRDEMRGEVGDLDLNGKINELGNIPDYDWAGIWQAEIDRLKVIPQYVDLFKAAYPNVNTSELAFVQAANALAAYQAETFTFEDSPWDRYLQGNMNALNAQEKRGALLFYGEAGCATCHSGGLMTDQKFHNIAVPQVGAGKGRERPLDLGRARETGNDCDRFAFRTPPLANVAITGPWMHDGAYTTLEAAVRHHMDMTNSLKSFEPSKLAPYLQKTLRNSEKVLNAIQATCQPIPVPANLSDAQVQDILAFLNALTSPSAVDMEQLIPPSVPSGLKVGGN